MIRQIFAGCLLLTSCFLASAGETEPDAKLLETYEAALLKLPEPFRERVGDVVLKRAPDLGLGPSLPLEYRLLNRAAYASFSISDRTLKVYDAGVRNRPTWEDEGPGASEVAKLLAGIADVLGVAAPKDENDPAFQEAWREFVRRVYAWEGGRVPDPLPSVNDKKLWNQFLGDGVWRLMGGKVSMEQLIFHEFGHALQLEWGISDDKTLYWGELSGFTETRDGEAADGWISGFFKMEEVMVLIRVLMAGDESKISRGENADTQVSDKARFVNRYARYDLREDYAESFRLMAYDPERLAKTAPEKFLFLNALGWNARLDVREPGPLWYSGAELDRLLPEKARKDGLARILGRQGDEISLSPIAVAAILRAHAGVLTKEDLPEPHPAFEFVNDLPNSIFGVLDPALLQVEIEGSKYGASPKRLRENQNELILNWLDHFEFQNGISKFRAYGTEGIEGGYEEGVKVAPNLESRYFQYESLRVHGRELVPEDTWRTWDLNEAKFHHEGGAPWLAARYSILGSEKPARELYAEIKEIADKGASGFERAQFIGTAVDVALKANDLKVIPSKIKAIPGETLGAWLRVRYALSASSVAEGKAKEELLQLARSEVAACQNLVLKEKLQRLVTEP